MSFGESRHALLQLENKAHSLLERERADNVVIKVTSMSRAGMQVAIDNIPPNPTRFTSSSSTVGDVGGNGELDKLVPNTHNRQKKDEIMSLPHARPNWILENFRSSSSPS